jgi:hypothetical protein
MEDDAAMSVPALVLKSGLSVAAPLGRVLAFCNNEYAYYDAVPMGDIDAVEPIDVLATVGINSRIDTADKVRTVHLGLVANCGPLLAAIATDADLLTFKPLSDVVTLLAAAMQTRYVLLATATKVLHRKRPALIPVLDSVVVAHYLRRRGEDRLLRQSWVSRPAAAKAAEIALDDFRDDLRNARPDLERLRAELVKRGFLLTSVRVLDILIWTETERSGYYR